ncbi:hypothetical protein [Candidatus Nitrosotenuis uzonensis]|uniref:Uncharacterized protein n=1 Tax=Candidatus Nitrosotenuis uzonensis TaxID=1407055 RepID=V6ARM1_9ARCH|nr:hypothetical protein [Candidatus Nitrosotenuis uzonensis]CDI05386.1 exported hypothetical protein [Candidatus Nitrosotenuis uzonensis]
MQKFASLFLFVIIGLLTLYLNSAFAQMENEEAMEDATMEDEMMMTMADDVILPPLQQLSLGVNPHDIECRDGQQLVFKASNWQPACINESSYSVLSARGWIAQHDPTHADLEKMMEKYMENHPHESETDDGQVDIKEEIKVDGQTGVNGTTVEEPKSHVIELREDMEMGAN